MSETRKILRIIGARTVLQANLNPAQIAIESDNNEAHVWKDDDGTYNVSAAVQEDLTTGSILFATAAGKIHQDNAKAFWNNSTKRLGLGITTPDNELHIHRATAGAIASDPDSLLTLENATTVSLQFLATTTNTIHFGDASSPTAGSISYNHPTNEIRLFTNATQKMTIHDDGDVGIGLTGTPGARVEIQDGGGGAQLRLSHDATHWLDFDVDGANSADLHITGQDGAPRIGIDKAPDNVLSVSGDVDASALILGGTSLAGTEILRVISAVNDCALFESTDVDALAGPIIEMYRNVAGAASDVVGQLLFTGQDIASGKESYASVQTIITDATAANPDAKMQHAIDIAGTLTPVAELDLDGLKFLNGATVHVVVQNGAPTSTVNGALWLDGNASVNGDLMMFSGGAWRKIVSLP